MNIKDLAVNRDTALLLKENGRVDRLAGISKEEGWYEICTAVGYTRWLRTPAMEAYEDGWYTPSPEEVEEFQKERKR